MSVSFYTHTHTHTHIYIYIYIMSCRRHGYPWPSLTTSPFRSSPLVGLQGHIPYPHRAAECMFDLVIQLFPGHMWGSIRVHPLWARPCFSKRSGSSVRSGNYCCSSIRVASMDENKNSHRKITMNHTQTIYIYIYIKRKEYKIFIGWFYIFADFKVLGFLMWKRKFSSAGVNF